MKKLILGILGATTILSPVAVQAAENSPLQTSATSEFRRGDGGDRNWGNGGRGDGNRDTQRSEGNRRNDGNQGQRSGNRGQRSNDGQQVRVERAQPVQQPTVRTQRSNGVTNRWVRGDNDRRDNGARNTNQRSDSDRMWRRDGDRNNDRNTNRNDNQRDGRWNRGDNDRNGQTNRNDRNRNDRNGSWNRGRDNDNRWNQGWRNDRRYDWRSHRQRYSNYYRPGRYYAPYRNHHYSRIRIGFSIGSGFYGSNYWISDPSYYRLPPAYGSYRWVRYYDDVLLIDLRTGYVVDVIENFFW